GKRWQPPVPPLTFTAWQLAAGSIFLVPVAFLVEGGAPPVTGDLVIGLGFGTLVATALAYVAWFHGLRLLPAGTVGLIGLLNPVTAAVLGVAIAGDPVGLGQVLGGILVIG